MNNNDNALNELREVFFNPSMQEHKEQHEHEQQISSTQGIRKVYSHFSFDDCMKNIEPTKWLIKGYIPEKSLCMMFAPSASGKSFVAIDMICSIACDEINDWHGKKLHHGPVIYFAGEGTTGIKKRIKGWALKRNVKSARIHIVDEAFYLDDSSNENYNIENTIANIKAMCDKPALIVFDTLNRYMGGDENKATDTSRMLLCFSRIIKECGCSILVIHHTGNSEDARKRVRGSSAWKGAVDVELRVTKSEKIITLEQTKNKDTEIQANMNFNLEQVFIPECYDDDGRQETTCTIELNNSIATESETEFRYTKYEQTAIRTFKEAIRKFGVRISDQQTGHEFAAVELTHWRKVAYELSYQDKDATKRREFNDGRKGLCEKSTLIKNTREGFEYYCLDLSDDTHSDSLTRLGVKSALGEREKEQLQAMHPNDSQVEISTRPVV